MAHFDVIAYQQRLVDAFKQAGAADLRRDFITVTAGEARYRIPAARVSSVDPLPVATPIPRALPWVMGVSNVRGRILTLAHFEHLLTGGRGSDPAYCLSLHDSSYALAVAIDLSDDKAPVVDLASVLPEYAIDLGTSPRPSIPAQS